ncbi:hypothetical protein QOT17_009257 [Balamuthia mandrillaris]
MEEGETLPPPPSTSKVVVVGGQANGQSMRRGGGGGGGGQLAPPRHGVAALPPWTPFDLVTFERLAHQWQDYAEDLERQLAEEREERQRERQRHQRRPANSLRPEERRSSTVKEAEAFVSDFSVVKKKQNKERPRGHCEGELVSLKQQQRGEEDGKKKEGDGEKVEEIIPKESGAEAGTEEAFKWGKGQREGAMERVREQLERSERERSMAEGELRSLRAEQQRWQQKLEESERERTAIQAKLQRSEAENRRLKEELLLLRQQREDEKVKQQQNEQTEEAEEAIIVEKEEVEGGEEEWDDLNIEDEPWVDGFIFRWEEASSFYSNCNSCSSGSSSSSSTSGSTSGVSLPIKRIAKRKLSKRSSTALPSDESSDNNNDNHRNHKNHKTEKKKKKKSEKRKSKRRKTNSSSSDNSRKEKETRDNQQTRAKPDISFPYDAEEEDPLLARPKCEVLRAAEWALQEAKRPMTATAIMKTPYLTGLDQRVNSLILRLNATLKDPDSPFIRISETLYGLKRHLDYYCDARIAKKATKEQQEQEKKKKRKKTKEKEEKRVEDTQEKEQAAKEPKEEKPKVDEKKSDDVETKGHDDDIFYTDENGKKHKQPLLIKVVWHVLKTQRKPMSCVEIAALCNEQVKPYSWCHTTVNIALLRNIPLHMRAERAQRNRRPKKPSKQNARRSCYGLEASPFVHLDVDLFGLKEHVEYYKELGYSVGGNCLRQTSSAKEGEAAEEKREAEGI